MNYVEWMMTFKVKNSWDTTPWFLNYVFIGYRENYSRHKRALSKQYKLGNGNVDSGRLQLEKDYKVAMQKQDQKIELAMRMYDLVSRHIERLDSQIFKSGLSEAEWIKSTRKGPNWHESQRKRGLDHSSSSSARKRFHSSSRLNADHMEMNEPTYCYCKQVSFGDMIACDGDNVIIYNKIRVES